MSLTKPTKVPKSQLKLPDHPPLDPELIALAAQTFVTECSRTGDTLLWDTSQDCWLDYHRRPLPWTRVRDRIVAHIIAFSARRPPDQLAQLRSAPAVEAVAEAVKPWVAVDRDGRYVGEVAL